MGVEDYNKQQLERLREHKIAFDQEAMWAAMQKKKKRRGALYFFTMALVALAIVFFTCFLFSRYNGENSNYSGENSRYDGENSSYNGENSSNIGENISEEKLSNLSKNENEKKSSEITKVNLDDNKVDTLESTLEDSSKNNESKASTTKFQSSINENIDIKKADNFSSRSSLKRTLANIYDSNIEDRITSTVGRFSESQNQNSNTQLPEITKALNNSNIESSKSNPDNLISIRPLKIHEFPFLESLRDLKIDLSEPDMTPPSITEVIKEPKSRFHIGAYGGVGYLFRQYSNGVDTSSLNSETLEEVSIGLELKYQLTPNFFVRSGVEYWHATERQENSSYSIINTNDLESFVPGMEEGIQITTTYSKVHSIYQSYNIPVVLGWNTNNDKWNLFAEAGLLYNFKTERRRDETLVSPEENIFEVGSQNQISPIAGIGMSFSLTNKFELFARTNWRGSQNVTLNESQQTLKYGAIRTQLGVRIGI